MSVPELLSYVVEPHPEGGWRLTGGKLSARGLWYSEAHEASSYAKLNASGRAYRVELQNRAGEVVKSKEYGPEDVRATR